LKQKRGRQPRKRTKAESDAFEIKWVASLKPNWMRVAPAVVKYSDNEFYEVTRTLFRNEQEAIAEYGNRFVSWPAGKLIEVPYLEPLK
jgi:hypothetical protein